MRTINKPFVIITVIAIIVITLASIGPTVYRALTTPGIKTEAIVADGAAPASTDINGTWTIVPGAGKNATQVGFPFHEALPGQRKDTSGSTHAVTGEVVVDNNILQSAELTVDATTLRTDIKKRDINVKQKILHTDQYPTAGFTTDTKVDLSAIPDNGTVGTVTVPGTLTLHGVSKEVEAQFKVLRTGKRVLLYSDLPVNREDYKVTTPEFVAAVIDEEGELNIRLDLEKIDQ